MPKILSRNNAFSLLAPALAVILMLSGCSILYKNAEISGLKTLDAEITSVPPVSLKARAIVSFTRTGGKLLRGKATVLAVEPNLFRIEFIGPFNQIAAILLSDGRGVYSFARKRTEYHFYNDPGYPYPFSATEIVTFLLGLGSLDNLGNDGELRMTIDDNGRVSSLTKNNGFGRIVFRASAEDYKLVDQRWFPHSVRIDNGTEALSIEYLAVELDASIDYDLFTVPRGSGTAKQ